MAGYLTGENPEELKNETFYLTYASLPGVGVKLTKDPSQRWILPYRNREHLRSFQAARTQVMATFGDSVLLDRGTPTAA